LAEKVVSQIIRQGKEMTTILIMITMTMIIICIACIASYIANTRKMKKKMASLERLAKKNWNMYLLMTQWVQKLQDGRSVEAYLVKKGYKNVAIYGMSYIGQTLLNELKGSQILVKYGVDRQGIRASIKMIKPNETFEPVDAVVCTCLIDAKKVENVLKEKMGVPVLNIQDILNEM